jgi:exonuclease SbcC
METFDIIVNDGNASRSYDTYSGGERFRLDFACHIGLARFLTNRVGANIEFFIIDEGLGSQDSFARQKFIEMLHRISGIFKQVMCITHISEVLDSFNSKILIEKDNLEGSKVVML